MLAVPRPAGEQTSNRATFGDVSPEVKTHGRDDVCAVQDFLRDFGYLTAGSFDAGSLDAATSSALERYQQRNGLVVTGVLDGPTRRVISQPRCGMPDLVGRAGFVALCPWVHPCLTFAFDIGTNDVPGGGEFQAVRDAFATWAAAAPLTFTEVGLHQHPDVVIGWRTAGDPDFDLAGKLAHADFPPGCGVVSDVLPKPVHFNDSTVNWTLGDLFFSHDVESVALHELGHILGLHHSDVDDAVMAPTLTSSSTRRVLAADDLAGITHLYPAAIPKLGVVTIRQQSTGRFLDAHEIAERDFRVVTRPDQDNETQRWLLNPVGTVNVIRQKTSGRFLDAFQSGFEGNVDFRLMTRDPAPDESQRWVVVPVGDGSVTIRQLSTNRLVDAHEIAENDFAAVTRPAQDDATQRWILSSAGANTVTMRQVSSSRFLDAHEVADKDFRVVTRPAQPDETQRWILAPVGIVCTLRQRSSGRALDAHDIAARDFAAVTRPVQGDDTQHWVVVPSADGSCTIRQLSTGRCLDAFADADHDFGAVTRPRRGTSAQRWFVDPA